jgi:hypothetical protein
MTMKVAVLMILATLASYGPTVYASDALPKASARVEAPRPRPGVSGSQVPEYLKAKHDGHKHDEREAFKGIIRPVAFDDYGTTCTICACSYADHWFWCIVGSLPAGFLCLTATSGVHTCNNFIGN